MESKQNSTNEPAKVEAPEQKKKRGRKKSEPEISEEQQKWIESFEGFGETENAVRDFWQRLAKIGDFTNKAKKKQGGDTISITDSQEKYIFTTIAKLGEGLSFAPHDKAREFAREALKEFSGNLRNYLSDVYNLSNRLSSLDVIDCLLYWFERAAIDYANSVVMNVRQTIRRAKVCNYIANKYCKGTEEEMDVVADIFSLFIDMKPDKECGVVRIDEKALEYLRTELSIMNRRLTNVVAAQFAFRVLIDDYKKRYNYPKELNKIIVLLDAEKDVEKFAQGLADIEEEWLDVFPELKTIPTLENVRKDEEGVELISLYTISFKKLLDWVFNGARAVTRY